MAEETAWEGVRRIAHTLASDMELVMGIRPEIFAREGDVTSGAVILCATCGRSPLLEKLSREGKLDLSPLWGKWEVYQIERVERPWEGVEEALVVCGSDKRGTIYGMFSLSEALGVTPFVYWGDLRPPKNPAPVLGEGVCVLSKEPSVRYRGFFINDEWPCFGSWVTEHFGGFGTEAYRHVFEFLLRMKGNYLWPAMWTSSFPLDGPGSANEELADLYGVIIGYSHHEPCLRASEEWDQVRGEDSPYGNEWNYHTNEKGLLRYWEDGLKRSGRYENVITIGMRGERDSSMLGEEASLEENIALLRKIITAQRGLIGDVLGQEACEKPLLLALYKEVEPFFYGDGAVKGLKDWEGLEDVICMLCEDNYGNMRTLPTEEMRRRRGGFGMYYHLDYHGGPVSYEWIDSTPLSKVWEQMCTAYEYGVRKLWIVNVGDVKFHEVPLSYFMALAYDFDAWGTARPDSAQAYVRQWASQNFQAAGEEGRRRIAQVFEDYIYLLSLRRPEALNENVYHPCHYLEADRMLGQARDVEERSQEILESLEERERDGYYSMVHFPAAAGMNLMKLHLYAAKNRHYASQGRTAANEYARLAKACMEKDRQLALEFGQFAGGKWDGMQLAPHIGFTRWNEDGCRYPILSYVTPVGKPRLSVSRKDSGEVYYKQYGAPAVIRVDDFLEEGCGEVSLEAANDGEGTLRYRIQAKEGLPGWLQVEPMEGQVRTLEEIRIRCLREKLPEAEAQARFAVTDGDTVVCVEVKARRAGEGQLPPMTFLPLNGVVTMDACHYCEKKDTQAGSFEVLSGYGRYGSAVKVFPVTRSFVAEREKPCLTYQFWLEEGGLYRVELLTAPTNPAAPRTALRIQATPGEGDSRVVELVPDTFRAGDLRDRDWCQGVLEQGRTASFETEWDAGLCRLKVEALDPGVVLERIRIYPAEDRLKESYLGPLESPRR